MVLALQRTVGSVDTAHGPGRWVLGSVLLVGEARNNFSGLARRLEARACECRFVASYNEALTLLSSEGFDLMVAIAPLPPGTISSLSSSLAGSRTTFFCAQPVEDGCWWLPIYRSGELCLGAPALRPSEFAALVDAFVEARRLQREIDLSYHKTGIVVPGESTEWPRLVQPGGGSKVSRGTAIGQETGELDRAVAVAVGGR